ncbi:MAG: hypothetical protein IKV29_02070 [Alistipes sp.]|nr:hypothetical protein [Alistipes sp.]
MTTQEQYIRRLKQVVTTKFGRTISTSDDCIALANAVAESVGVVVDNESLEQLFLDEQSHVAPRPVVLTTLSRYVGFTGWGEFCTARDITPAEERYKLPIVRRWGAIALSALALIAVIVTIFSLVGSGDDVEGEVLIVDNRFRNLESQWVARTLERCNTLRAYYNENEPERYNRRVDSFISKYRDQLEKSVKSDIENYALHNKITVDNATIDQTAEIIIEKCLALCEDIKIE